MSYPNSQSLHIPKEGTSLLMSRQSTPASELGRLALGSSGDNMPALTRSMTKAQPSSSQGGSSRAPQQSSSAAGKAPARNMPTTSSPPEEESDSEEESSDDDDESEPDQGQQLRQTIQLAVFATLSMFEPNQLSWAEMTSRSQTNLKDYPYGKFATVVMRLVRTQADLKMLMEDVEPVSGPKWSAATLSNMRLRAQRIFESFGQWVRNPAQPSGNVIDTVAAVFSFYYAVDTTLRQFTKMQYQAELVALLLWTLEQVIANDRDVRDLRGGGHPVYAGGATQYEHNLFLRFTSSPELEQRFWQVLSQTVGRVPSAFKQPATQARLRSMWEQASEKAHYENAGVRAFIERFRQVLVSLQVIRAAS